MCVIYLQTSRFEKNSKQNLLSWKHGSKDVFSQNPNRDCNSFNFTVLFFFMLFNWDLILKTLSPGTLGAHFKVSSSMPCTIQHAVGNTVFYWNVYIAGKSHESI